MTSGSNDSIHSTRKGTVPLTIIALRTTVGAGNIPKPIGSGYKTRDDAKYVWLHNQFFLRWKEECLNKKTTEQIPSDRYSVMIRLPMDATDSFLFSKISTGRQSY